VSVWSIVLAVGISVGTEVLASSPSPDTGTELSAIIWLVGTEAGSKVKGVLVGPAVAGVFVGDLVGGEVGEGLLGLVKTTLLTGDAVCKAVVGPAVGAALGPWVGNAVGALVGVPV
jgi:hypothetical protein